MKEIPIQLILIHFDLQRRQNGLLENLALRQQLSIYKRKQKRQRLTGRDRWFWIALAAVWKDWRKSLVVVHPDTVIRWQRERFRRYWASLYEQARKTRRPPITVEIGR